MNSNKKQPEYLTWPLEKLQNEYYALNVRYLAERVSKHDTEQKTKDVEILIETMKRLMEGE